MAVVVEQQERAILDAEQYDAASSSAERAELVELEEHLYRFLKPLMVYLERKRTIRHSHEQVKTGPSSAR